MPVQASLNLVGRNFDFWNLHLILKILYASCLDLSPAISVQFTLKSVCCRLKSWNREKFTKNLSFGGLKLSVLINLKSPSPVLVLMCSMCVPICNRFNTKRASVGENDVFLEGIPLWCPRLRGTPLLKGTKFCHNKLQSLCQPTVKILWFWFAPFW